jgi:hypothetical protein
LLSDKLRETGRLTAAGMIALIVVCQPAWAQRTIHCTAHEPDFNAAYTSDSIEIRQTTAGYEIIDLLMNFKDSPRTRGATPIFETHDRQEVVLYLVEKQEETGRSVSMITVDFRAVRVERYEPSLRLGESFWPGAMYKYTGCTRLD